RRATYQIEALNETNPSAQTVCRSDLRRAHTRRNNTRRRLSSWNPNPSQQDFLAKFKSCVPDPRRLQIPVQNRASSRSHHRQLEFSINQLAKEATRDPIGGSVRPARVRGLSAHLGGPVSTICKT
ncbi:hypothetical protein IGI04_042903, partial [Brassica rapa subsp. trilocularis]